MQTEEPPFLWNVCKSRMEPDFKTFDQQLESFFVDFTSLMITTRICGASGILVLPFVFHYDRGPPSNVFVCVLYFPISRLLMENG